MQLWRQIDGILILYYPESTMRWAYFIDGILERAIVPPHKNKVKACSQFWNWWWVWMHECHVEGSQYCPFIRTKTEQFSFDEVGTSLRWSEVKTHSCSRGEFWLWLIWVLKGTRVIDDLTTYWTLKPRVLDFKPEVGTPNSFRGGTENGSENMFH